MELKPQWTQVFMRAQSMARKHDGLSIISMTIVANADGVPLYWIPRCIPLEPRVNANIDEMKKNMTKEQLETLLQVLMRMEMR